MQNQSIQGPNQSIQGPNQSIQGPNQSIQGPNQSIQGSNQSIQGPNQSIQGPSEYQSPPFSSIYEPIYNSVQEVVLPQPTEIRTPAIPYNYMPRPAYTTSPGDLPAYNSYNGLFDYNDENYKKQVNDKLLDKRVLDFSNPVTSGTFTPSITKSSLL